MHSTTSPQRRPLRRSVTSPASPTREAVHQLKYRAGDQQPAAAMEQARAPSRPLSVSQMEAAICRLASQHVMSDYNKMKRLTAANQAALRAHNVPANKGQADGSSGKADHTAPQGQVHPPVPAIPHDYDSENAAAQALLGLGNSQPRSAALSRPQPSSLEPPPAPKLHRTYTEEEGQNPRLHLPSDVFSPSSQSTLDTPALSMSTSSTVSKLGRDTPATPPEPAVIVSSDLSPVQPRTAEDFRMDRELSAQLTDAMDHSLVPVSAIPMNSTNVGGFRKRSPFIPAGLTNSLAAPLRGLGIVRSASSTPSTSSSSVSMSRSTSMSGQNAMSGSSANSHTSVPGPPGIRNPLAGVKTSLTHPLNLSPLVPAELLPLYGQSILQSAPSRYETLGSRAPLSKISVNIDANGDDPRPPSPTKSRPSSPYKAAGSRSQSPAKSSSASMMSISRPTTPLYGSGVPSGRPFVIAPSPDIHQLTGPDASVALFNLNLLIAQSLAMTAKNAGSATPSIPLRIGNLMLSSCPGKKVRVTDSHLSLLNIPVICRPGPAPVDPRTLPGAGVAMNPVLLAQANRSPICRDIELDLRKAMQEGECKAVVCCLDDTELKFLGAPWSEYERVARHIGMEVIRLPMAEGFAPASPEQLDAHLRHIITTYSLKGHNVLVHCRGGVGRAGLFACAWMLKMGLFGPIVGMHDAAGQHLDNELRTIERVIEVIRRRRSLKAIETPAQVQFMLQYVHWLSTNAQILSAGDVLRGRAP